MAETHPQPGQSASAYLAEQQHRQMGELARKNVSLLVERDRLREALTYLADAESWQGDPVSHDATLLGHFTPYELARGALRDA
jgi:hypothetical protein